MTGSSMRLGQILFFSLCLATIMFFECHSYPTNYEDDLESTTQNDDIAHVSMEQEDFKRSRANIHLGSVCEIAETPILYDCWRKACNSLLEKAKTFIVPFKTRFARVPKVMVALAAIDVANSANARINTEVKQVTTKGFTVDVKSWSNTKFYMAKVNWIACGPRRPKRLLVQVQTAQ